MAQVNTVVFPLANYPNGQATSPTVNVADAATTVSFQVSRCTNADLTIWPNSSTALSLLVEQSNDQGTTWRTLFLFTADGGIATQDDGSQSPASFVTTTLFPGPSRKLRATVTVAGGPLRSQGTFQVS